MNIKPYPEEEKCQSCHYAREIPNNTERISCRYGKPSLTSPYWPEVDKTAWCGKYHYDENFKPIHKEITYMTRTSPTCHLGHIDTFTDKEPIIRKRIKDKYPEAIFPDEGPTLAVDLSKEPRDPWGWAR